MFDMVSSEIDEVASVLAVINPTYDDNILHARLSQRTNLGKYQMSVGSTTATCGQHILEPTDLVGIMDGSLIAGSYNGYTVGSLVGSTFDKNPVGFKDGSSTPPTVIIQDNNKETNDDSYDPYIINEDSVLDDLFQKSLKGELDIDIIMVSAMYVGWQIQWY